MPQHRDLTGQTFGRLSVIDLHSKRKTEGGTSKIYWNCICDCGNKKVVDGIKLKNKHTISCGCLHKEILIKRNKEVLSTHKQTKTRLYNVHRSMISRCKDKTNKHYGGRGINVCDEWKVFETFYDWAMKNGYRDDLTIERINVNGDYTPNNCCFIPRNEQALNKTTTKYLTIFGETKPLVEWSRDNRCSVKLCTLAARIRKNWELEKALTEPVN